MEFIVTDTTVCTCWSKILSLSNNQFALLPGLRNPLLPTSNNNNIPFWIYLFDPFKTGIVKQYIKYPIEFTKGGPILFDATYRKKTRDIFILDFFGDVYKINIDSLKWEKICHVNMGSYSCRPRPSKNRIFIRNNTCHIIAAVNKNKLPDTDTECYKIWEINEKTKQSKEICCSKSYSSSQDPWNTPPITTVLLNKSNDVVIICEGTISKYMQLLKFCTSNGSIQNIKLNDSVKLIMTGHVVLRDNKIILFEKNDANNEPWINIVDLKKGTITKSLLLACDACMYPIHPVLIENITREELLVHGYCNQNNYTIPLPIKQLITTNFYADESILFIITDKEKIQYAVCEVVDIFVTEKKHIKFTNAKMS